MIADPATVMPDDELRVRLDRVQRLALIVGGVGLAMCAAAWLFWPGSFFHAYLVGYVFWVGITLGCLGLTMLHHLVGGGWGLPIRRPMESAGVTLAPLAILFIPLLLGLPHLYEWARPAAVEADPILQAKSSYLNVGFFLGRTGIYFTIWVILALMTGILSAAQDGRDDYGPSRWLGALLGGPGLILLFLTGSFAAIDWMMSLEPHWVSSIYGAMVVVGEGLSTLAMMVLVVVLMSDRRPMAEAATPGRLHDLGNLMLAFTMLWAYMAFSQYLIIWSGNLPEEIPWYLRRAPGAWQWVALALLLFHFFLPFFVLLFRENKRHGRLLARVAAWVLAMHWLDLVWLIIPASIVLEHGSRSPGIPWGSVVLSLASLAGVGGIWVAAFLWRLKAWPMIPLNDPNLNEVLEHAGG